jgi:hypothetical protein
MITKTARCGIAFLLSSSAEVVGAQGLTPGRLEGTVTDSVSSGPLADAVVTTVRLDATPSTPLLTTSDRRGRFVFHGLPPGRYSVRFASGLLDSLEFGITPVIVTVPVGSFVRADLATPSGATLRAAACPGAGLAKWTGALLGAVTDASTGRPLANAELTVSWSELAVDSTVRDLTPKPRSARVTTSANGQYRLCGLPTDEQLDMRIQHGERVGRARTMTVPDAQGVLVRNLSFTAEPASAERPAAASPGPQRARVGSASIVGRITRSDGAPVVGAQVRIVNSVSTARTDEHGDYSLLGVPEGAHELEARRLGYGILRRPVEVRGDATVRENVIMERVVSLDSVKVVARPVRFAEFERNRVRYPGGIFLDEDEMARRGYRTLPLMVSSTSGFRTVALPRGRIGVQSVHQRRCQEFSGPERLPALNLVVDNMEFVDVVEVQFPRVVAMEIYENGEKAPWKYARACSVIVLWTRDMGRSMRPPIDPETATIVEPKPKPKPAAPRMPMPTF